MRRVVIGLLYHWPVDVTSLMLMRAEGPSRSTSLVLLFPPERIAIIQRLLVVGERVVINGRRQIEAGRQAGVEKARRLQLGEARQVRDLLQPEMIEEARRGAEGHRSPWRLAAAAQ